MVAPVDRELDNAGIAEGLEEAATLLEAQEANPFRVRAYRTAAERVRALDESVVDLIARDGRGALEQLPGIGPSLARAIDQLAHHGHFPILDQLRGGTGPSSILATVPGIGPELAERIHERLGVSDLHDLEAAAHDGRLASVPGFGRRRVQSVRETLAGRLQRGAARGGSGIRPSIRGAAADAIEPGTSGDRPAVDELLELDAQYRRKAAADRLPRIAPRRFNPGRKAWLPIMHAQRQGRHFTVLYSNTARAHEVGATDDWVVIYRDDDDGRGQWTVVTARYGSLAGRRIVRGREEECRGHYARTEDGMEAQGATEGG